jgi:hypothetical protein
MRIDSKLHEHYGTCAQVISGQGEVASSTVGGATPLPFVSSCEEAVGTGLWTVDAVESPAPASCHAGMEGFPESEGKVEGADGILGPLLNRRDLRDLSSC